MKLISGVVNLLNNSKCLGEKKREHEKMLEENKKILDKIDFVPYLKQERDIEKIMHNVVMDLDDTELTNNEICQGCTFNWLTTEEFAYYLEARYNDRVSRYEETITKTYIDYHE